MASDLNKSDSQLKPRQEMAKRDILLWNSLNLPYKRLGKACFLRSPIHKSPKRNRALSGSKSASLSSSFWDDGHAILLFRCDSFLLALPCMLHSIDCCRFLAEETICADQAFVPQAQIFLGGNSTSTVGTTLFARQFSKSFRHTFFMGFVFRILKNEVFFLTISGLKCARSSTARSNV